MKKINKKLGLGLFFLAVFWLAVLVWYSPVLFKGYSAYSMNTNMLMSRNIYQTGLHSAENDLNVFLSSNLVEEQGHASAYGNKLTPLIYAKIFKITGLLDGDNIVLLSIIVHALTLLVFSGIVLFFFGFRISLIFSLIYIFLPFNWHLPYRLATYEFALLFLSLFFLFYFYGIKRKRDYIYFIIAGAFLALACLSREALILIVPFLLVYLWFIKQKKYLVFIFIPFVILFAIFWLPDVGHNAYLQFFTTQASKDVKSADFLFYGHVYPDPYTYHFEQKEFLENLNDQINNGNLSMINKMEKVNILKSLGIQGIGLMDRIKISLMLGTRHIFRLISLEDIGGPFVLLLMLLGACALRQKNKYLYRFLVGWIFFTILLLVLLLMRRSHLMDFNWAIALLASLGCFVLARMIINYFNLKVKKAAIVYLIILLLVLYNLVLVNHVTWGNAYEKSNILLIEAYSQEVEKISVLDKDIIAVPFGAEDFGFYNLNYLTNKSIVSFSPETIKKLLKENKLGNAFEVFKVKYVLGYTDDLSEKIIKQVDVKNIASDSLRAEAPKVSRNKGWFMNLVK